MIIYFAKKYSNTFNLIDYSRSEYHSDFSCDLCYSNSYTDPSYDFKTIISTPLHYYRVCSECVNTQQFNIVFSDFSDEIKKKIENYITHGHTDINE